MRAEAAGYPAPWRQQALLGLRAVGCRSLRDVFKEHVVEHLGTAGSAPIIGETGFLKKGQAFYSVRQQYTGSSASCR